MGRSTNARLLLKDLPKDAINIIEHVVFRDIHESFEKNQDNGNVGDLEVEIDFKSKVVFDPKDDIYKRTMYYILKYSGFYSEKIESRLFNDKELETEYNSKVKEMTDSLKFRKIQIKHNYKLDSVTKYVQIKTELTVDTKNDDIKKLAKAFLHGGETTIKGALVPIEKMDSLRIDYIESDINNDLRKWIDENYKSLYAEVRKKFAKELPKKVELK